MISSAPQSSLTRFSTVSTKKATGVHYTPDELARYVATEMIKAVGGRQTRPLRVLDPAVGDGALLLALAEQLPEALKEGLRLVGFDTSEAAVESARARLLPLTPRVSVTIEHVNFLDYVEHIAKPSLFADSSHEPFDLLISNPPYVRTQILGAKEARRLATLFGLKGRIDLYQVFLCAVAAVLRPGATAGVIVSNRVLTTRSSASLRCSLLQDFEIRKVVDLGDTRLFAAAVLPAVLLLTRRPLGCAAAPATFESVYQISPIATSNHAESPLGALRFEGPVACRSGIHVEVRRGHLDIGTDDTGVWRLTDREVERWLTVVAEHTGFIFNQIGKVRVGVKTTADEVFISSGWHGAAASERPELLRPLLTHHVAAPFRPIVKQPPLEILYPHTKLGGKRVPVDIEDYPVAAAYLKCHRARLEARSYVREAGRRWYEIWVPQDPDLWRLPKLVFPDIARSPAFFVDLTGAVVNGDCYWMVPRTEDSEELLWLAAAVANSPFAEKFYDLRFNNKLYAGRRRFITQYVELFPLPAPSTPVSREIVLRCRHLYEALASGEQLELRADLNSLVARSFGLLEEEAVG